MAILNNQRVPICCWSEDENPEAATASDTIWSPEQRATCNELQVSWLQRLQGGAPVR